MKKEIILYLAFGALVSCKKGIDSNEGLRRFSSSKGNQVAITSVPQSLKAKNLTFDAGAYNQFFADIRSNSTLVNGLYSTIADNALNYTATPFKQIDSGESGENQASSDGIKSKALALKFIATNDYRYRDKAIQILVAWAKINTQTWHRPRETAFLEMYEAYSMLKSNTNGSDVTIIDGWIRKRATTGSYNFSQLDGNEPNKVNNWEAIRILFLFYSGYILQDATMVNSAYTSYYTFLDKFLLAGGQTKDFKDRDAFAYLAYGMQYVSRIVKSVYNYEGATAANNLYIRKNNINVNLPDVINFWEPYLTKELTYTDFKNSIFATERTDRVGTYSPEGSLYALDHLVHQDVNKIYPFIKFLRTGDKSRFANLTIYLNTLRNPNAIN